MKAGLSMALCSVAAMGMAAPVLGAVFVDDFGDSSNNTTASTDASVSIGAGYALSQTGGTRQAQAAIVSGKAVLTETGSGTGSTNIVLRQQDLALPATGVPGQNAWRVEADITTHSSASNSLLYGLAFNWSGAGNYYAIRMNTQTDSLNLIQVVNGTLSNARTATIGTVPGASMTYHLSVFSSQSGVFNVTLTGGSGSSAINFSNIYTDASPDFTGGYAGLYISNPASTVGFDGLRIDSDAVPEPAALGILLTGGVLMLAARRKR